MVELKGIMVFSDKGHKHVDVVVCVDNADRYDNHRLGVDVKVNRGMVLKFLSEKYGVPAGDIVWPGHIMDPGAERETVHPL